MTKFFDLLFKKKHACSCSIDTDKCKFIENEKKHECICKINFVKCRTSENQHNCICEISNDECNKFHIETYVPKMKCFN
jgi:hypothetical protein